MTELKIEPHGDVFTVYFQGEDIYFSTLEEAVNFIGEFAARTGINGDFQIHRAEFYGQFTRKEGKNDL